MYCGRRYFKVPQRALSVSGGRGSELDVERDGVAVRDPQPIPEEFLRDHLEDVRVMGPDGKDHGTVDALRLGAEHLRPAKRPARGLESVDRDPLLPDEQD